MDVLLLLELVLDVMMHYYYKVKVILYVFYGSFSLPSIKDIHMKTNLYTRRYQSFKIYPHIILFEYIIQKERKMNIIDMTYNQKYGIVCGLESRGVLQMWRLDQCGSWLRQELVLMESSCRVMLKGAGIGLCHRPSRMYICTQHAVSWISLARLNDHCRKSADRKGGYGKQLCLEDVPVGQPTAMFVSEAQDEDLEPQEYVVVGTEAGELYYHNTKTHSTQCIWTNPEPASRILHIGGFRNENYLLVGCESMMYLLNPLTWKTVQVLQIPNNLPIKCIHNPPNSEHFYTVHKNHILQWTNKLNKCQSQRIMMNVSFIEQKKGVLWIGGQYRISVVQENGENEEIQSSINYVSQIKKVGQWIGAGGYGVLELYLQNQCRMILYTV